MYHAEKIPLSLQCLKINIAASSAGRRWTLRTEDTAEKTRNGKAMRKAYLSVGRTTMTVSQTIVPMLDSGMSIHPMNPKHVRFVARQQESLKPARNTHQTCPTPALGHLMTANTKRCSLRSGSTPLNFSAAAKTYSTAMSERKFTGMAYHRGQTHISLLKDRIAFPVKLPIHEGISDLFIQIACDFICSCVLDFEVLDGHSE